MAKIYTPDFWKPREKALEDNWRWPFAKPLPWNVSQVPWNVRSQVNTLLKMKTNKSKFYDFDTPDKNSVRLWLEFFDEFSLKLKYEIISYFDWNEELTQIASDVEASIRYLRNLLHSLLVMDKTWNEVLFYDTSEPKNLEIKFKYLIFDLLTDICIYEDMDESTAFIDIDNLDDSSKRKIKIIETKIDKLFLARGHKIYRQLWWFGMFYWQICHAASKLIPLYRHLIFISNIKQICLKIIQERATMKKIGYKKILD